MSAVADVVIAAFVGFASGVLSGLFGIGGGLVTTPAIRLVLGYPELVAVGTPLLVILPTALTGALSYVRRGSADIRTGLLIGAWGAPGTLVGAMAATYVGGSIVLVLTAVLIAYMAVEMIRQSRNDSAGADAQVGAASEDSGTTGRVPVWVLGLMTGLYSGFLGLGGGFVIVPLLGRWFGFPVKRAIGTSLIAIAVVALPGTVAHYLLGNVDVGLALGLMVGVVPGALMGAKMTAVASDRHVKVGFAVFLLVTGLVLALGEAGVL